MKNKASNGEMTQGYLLGTFCRQHGLTPTVQGNDVVIKFVTGTSAHRVLTIPEGARRLPTDPVPPELVGSAEKIRHALPFVTYVEAKGRKLPESTSLTSVPYVIGP